MRRKNRRAVKSEYLDKVITLSECARRFSVAKSTVVYAINANLIAYKECGGVILIDVESAEKQWVKPNER